MLLIPSIRIVFTFARDALCQVLNVKRQGPRSHCELSDWTNTDWSRTCSLKLLCRNCSVVFGCLFSDVHPACHRRAVWVFTDGEDPLFSLYICVVMIWTAIHCNYDRDSPMTTRTCAQRNLCDKSFWWLLLSIDSSFVFVYWLKKKKLN